MKSDKLKSKNIFRQFIMEYKQGGLSGLLYKFSEYEYLPTWLFHLSKSNMYIYDGDCVEKYNYKDKQDKYKFDVASKADIESILKLSGLTDKSIQLPMARLIRFFDNGNSCYIIRLENKIIAFLMLYKGQYVITRDDYKSINMNVRLDDNILFFGYGFIMPKYRMRGLFPYMMNYAMSSNKGAVFITDIADLNKHSHRSHIKLGFKTIYSVVAVRLFLKSMICWRLLGADSVFLSKKAVCHISVNKSDNKLCITGVTKRPVYPAAHSLLYK